VSLANWRDLAVILLVIEAFIMVLVPGVILYFSLRGMLWLIRKLRIWMPQLQSYFYKASEITRRVSEKIAAPVIALDATSARVKGMGTSASYLVKKREV
jgi:hypothetical protein